jgi:hypothetical protein
MCVSVCVWGGGDSIRRWRREGPSRATSAWPLFVSMRAGWFQPCRRAVLRLRGRASQQGSRTGLVEPGDAVQLSTAGMTAAFRTTRVVCITDWHR